MGDTDVDSNQLVFEDKPIYQPVNGNTPTHLHTNSTERITRLLKQDNDIEIDSPMVAIIIDDFGPGLSSKLVAGFMELPHDITISVIPGNLHSAKVGREAAKVGKEVFIHLPMEPIDSVSMDEPDMIYTDVDSLTLNQIMTRVADELPQAVGVNNHMGSKATLSDSLMAGLARELKRRNWIFIDSRTVPLSRGLPQMKRADVLSAGRDIFLDFNRDMNVIRDQLTKAVNIAKSRGWSIAIGHVRKNTLKVLAENLPEFENDGIRFVFITELLETIVRHKDNAIAESSK